MEPMLEHAVAYLHAELPIFPVCSPTMGPHEHWSPERKRMIQCENPGKTPMVRWRGYQLDLPSEDDVRIWWKQWPTANIGMATGALSGVLVLDADGTEARKECLRRGGLDETPTVWTGKIGGAHFHLAYPEGQNVRNFARRLPGTDMRGEGGYVLLPPSLHASGNRYRWAEGTQGIPPSAPPQWLLDLAAGVGEGGSGTADERERIDVDAALLGFPEGQRNDGLFRFACRMRHDDTPQAYAELLIQESARNCRPAFPLDEAVAIVRRVYREYQPGNIGPEVEADEFFAATADPSPIDDVPDEADEGWKVYDAEAFLAIDFPPIVWRIEGYLRERAILFSYGPPGSIKTFVATDAAISIASGEPFLNQFPCQRGRVLIVQEDTLASDYQQAYLRPMLSARGLSGSDVKDTLFIAPQADFALDRNDRLTDLCAWLESSKPDLLILDSFYLMYSGKKEDLLTIMKIVKKIRNKYGCAIWIIDHNRKGQGDVPGENPIDRLINGREKSAAVDVVMESRPVKNESGSVFLDVLKLRGVKLPEPIRVTYEDGRFTVDGTDEVTPQGAAQTVYEWLCREGASRTVKQIMSGCGLADRTVRGALSELHIAGLVRPMSGAGPAKTWYGIRRADAQPEPGPSVEFDGFEAE